jgi:hypothetical protein
MRKCFLLAPGVQPPRAGVALHTLHLLPWVFFFLCHSESSISDLIKEAILLIFHDWLIHFRACLYY